MWHCTGSGVRLLTSYSLQRPGADKQVPSAAFPLYGFSAAICGTPQAAHDRSRRLVQANKAAGAAHLSCTSSAPVVVCRGQGLHDEVPRTAVPAPPLLGLQVEGCVLTGAPNSSKEGEAGNTRALRVQGVQDTAGPV